MSEDTEPKHDFLVCDAVEIEPIILAASLSCQGNLGGTVDFEAMVMEASPPSAAKGS